MSLTLEQYNKKRFKILSSLVFLGSIKKDSPFYKDVNHILDKLFNDNKDMILNDPQLSQLYFELM